APLLDELAEGAETGTRCERRLVVVRAEDPEQVTRLGERLAPRLLDCEERLAGAFGVLAEEQARRTRLDGHDAHAVDDHVVEVARDPAPLSGDGGARLLLVSALQPGSLRLERARPPGAGPQRVRGERDSGGQRDEEDDLDYE